MAMTIHLRNTIAVLRTLLTFATKSITWICSPSAGFFPGHSSLNFSRNPLTISMLFDVNKSSANMSHLKKNNLPFSYIYMKYYIVELPLFPISDV